MDIKLGEREITFDLDKVTQGEWEDIIDGKGGIKAEREILSKTSGLSLDEMRKLSRNEYKQLISKFIEVNLLPLKSPNSASGSLNT